MKNQPPNSVDEPLVDLPPDQVLGADVVHEDGGRQPAGCGAGAHATPPQVKPTGGGPTWYLQRKAPDLLDREGLQAGAVGAGHDGLAVDEFAPVAAPALPGSGAAGRRPPGKSAAMTREHLVMPPGSGAPPPPLRERSASRGFRPEWLPSGSGSRPRPGLPTRRPGRPPSGSSCPWPRDVRSELRRRAHPETGQLSPVDHGAVCRAGGELDVDQDRVGERRGLAWLPSEREGEPVPSPDREHIVPSPEERLPDPRPVPPPLPAVREQEVAELPDRHDQPSTCGPRRVRSENAGPYCKAQVERSPPAPRHRRDAPPVRELEDRDGRPFRGRKQRELSGQRLPILDDSSERQASGFPLRGLPDGLDDGEDRVEPVARDRSSRGLLDALRRRLGGFRGPRRPLPSWRPLRSAPPGRFRDHVGSSGAFSAQGVNGAAIAAGSLPSGTVARAAAAPRR